LRSARLDRRAGSLSPGRGTGAAPAHRV